MRKHAAKILITTMVLFVLSIVIVEIAGSRRGGAARKTAAEQLKTQGEVATLNGKEIDAQYFMKRYNTLLMNYKSPLQKDPLDPKLNEEIQYYAFQKTIEYQKYLTLAKKYRIKATNRELKTQLTAIKSYYKIKSNRELKKLLAQNGYRYKDFLKELKNEITVAKLLESAKGKIVVTPEDVKNEFKKVKARHILISVMSQDEQKPEELKKAARKKIAEIYSQLVKGADFAELAKKYSEDPGSAPKGGDLGLFGTGQMIPEFEKEAFALKPGEYSKPFETIYGFHIVKVDQVVGGTIPLDVDEKEEIKKITERRTQAALAKLAQEADKNTEVEIYLPTLLAYDHKYKGEYDKALGTYQLLASQSPQSPIPHIFTAEIYQLQKDYTQAKAEFDRALLKEKMFPGTKTPFVHFYLGKLYAAQKKNALAAQEYQTAEALVKDNLAFLLQVKQAYQDIGYTAQAGKTQLKIKAIEAAWKMAQEKSQNADDFKVEQKKK